MPLDTILRPRSIFLGEDEHKIDLMRLHIAYTTARDRIYRSQEERLARENRDAKYIDFKIAVVDLFHGVTATTKQTLQLPPDVVCSYCN